MLLLPQDSTVPSGLQEDAELVAHGDLPDAGTDRCERDRQQLVRERREPSRTQRELASPAQYRSVGKDGCGRCVARATGPLRSECGCRRVS